MARSFNGSSDCLFRSSFSPATAYPATIAFWFYPANNSVNQAMINWAGDVPGNNNVGVGLDGTAAGDPIYLYLKSGGVGAANATTSTGITLSTWMHACGVLASATDRRCYLNGGSVGSSTTNVSFPATPTTFTLAAYHNNSVASTFFAGRLCEVAVWSAALDATEVNALAVGFSPLLVRPQALLDYWPLNVNPTAGPDIDLWRGNGLTLSGSPALADQAAVRRPRRRPLGLAVPITFNPAWARGANVLVGPGVSPC